MPFFSTVYIKTYAFLNRLFTRNFYQNLFIHAQKSWGELNLVFAQSWRGCLCAWASDVCVCVRFRCVCVRALQMCVCVCVWASDVCVRELQMCVCVQASDVCVCVSFRCVCVCKLQMCVCAWASDVCVCVRFRCVCVCVSFRCVCVRVCELQMCVCACVSGVCVCASDCFANNPERFICSPVPSGSSYIESWYVRLMRMHSLAVMHRQTLYENVDSDKIKVPFYMTDIDMLRVASMHRIVTHFIDILIHIDESLHP